MENLIKKSGLLYKKEYINGVNQYKIFTKFGLWIVVDKAEKKGFKHIPTRFAHNVEAFDFEGFKKTFGNFTGLNKHSLKWNLSGDKKVFRNVLEILK